MGTKDAIAYQHAIEQSGARYDSLVRLIDKVRDARTKSWKVDSQMLILRLKRYNLLDKEKGIMTKNTEILKRSAEWIMKYKEGYERATVAQKVFGDASIVPILEKIADFAIKNNIETIRMTSFDHIMKVAHIMNR